MKTPVMPSGLKTQIQMAFKNKEVDTIIVFNNIWYQHIEELRVEAKRQAEQEGGN